MKKISALISACLVFLAGCGLQSENSERATPLTEEEIVKATEAFASTVEGIEGDKTVIYPTEISCFFTSYYSAPTEINLVEFLSYCPAGETLEGDDEEELQAVDAALTPECGFASGNLASDFPIRRIYKKDVTSLLKKYANITADDLSNTEGTLYLEEYDAYYTFTSDFSPGSFVPSGGERLGDTITFWSGGDNGKNILTILEADGNYFIHSFQRVVTQD